MKTKEKFTLGLNMPTDPSWANLAEKSLEDILVDHAFCEQKAASSCISLIVQYSDKKEVVEMLTPVVREEWSHFEMVLKKLGERGFSLGKQRPDEYVNQISGLTRKGGSRDAQLVEKLLLGALIEARSCERFKQLWQSLKDPDLQDFYYHLMISEAGHYKIFLQLAKEYMPEKYVMDRWKQFLEGEAKIIKSMNVRGDRMH